MKFSFENKTVVITGAGRGIGKAAAISFAKAGANVVLASRTQQQLDDVQAIISEFNPNVMSYLIDVKDRHACEDLISKTVERFGSLNILVHSASDYFTTFLNDMEDEDMAKHIDSNVNAARWLLKAALPYLHETEGRGRFIAIGSVGGSATAITGMTAYCVAKAGLEAFIKQAALEYGFLDKQVLINLVLPGIIISDRAMELDSKEHLEKITSVITPLRRPGTSDEISDVCMFLASPGASYIHGTTILVDGGLTVGTVVTMPPV